MMKILSKQEASLLLEKSYPTKPSENIICNGKIDWGESHT